MRFEVTRHFKSGNTSEAPRSFARLADQFRYRPARASRC